jgi:geranylgeranyl diphosphate synthase type I
MDLKSTFKKKIAKINWMIEKALSDLKCIESPKVKGKPTLYEITKHVMKGGKRIRPLICMLTCDGLGGDSAKILPTAAGIELIHTFTLVHDDIMDGDGMRRGRPSLHSKWGEPLAILTGDTLFALAYKCILSNLGVDGIDKNRVNRTLDLSVDACLKLAQGQIMDLSLTPDSKIEWKDEIIRLKTAPLFSLATKTGALLGNGSEEEIESMEKYGLYLGMAFQIKDDILNLTGNTKRIGKPNGRDLKNGRLTLPIAHALRKTQKGDKKRILSALGKESTSVIELIRKSGSIEYSEGVARKLIEEAKQSLGVLKRENERAALAMLANYAVERGG